MTDLKALTIALACIAAPVAAQDAPQFVVPSGCAAFLTVQSRQCTVAHYWTCEAEEDGVFWNVLIDSDGPYYLSQSDADYRWLQGFSLRSDSQSALLSETDPADLDELFETGRDNMVFTVERRENGVTFQTTYEGYDAISGAEVVIDGEPLLLTEFGYDYETEQGPRSTSGNQFLHRDWRLFFGGIETTVLPDGEAIETDRSPREFIEPGEPGFLSMIPLYDCGDTMSALPWTPEDRG